MVLAFRENAGEFKLKPIVEVLDETPILTAEQLRLAAWMRERLYCTYFDCVHAMLPAGLWFKRNETYTLAAGRGFGRLCGSGTAKTVRCWRCLSSGTDALGERDT